VKPKIITQKVYLNKQKKKKKQKQKQKETNTNSNKKTKNKKFKTKTTLGRKVAEGKKPKLGASSK
jgi:hypothetical protein